MTGLFQRNDHISTVKTPIFQGKLPITISKHKKNNKLMPPPASQYLEVTCWVLPLHLAAGPVNISFQCPVETFPGDPY